VIADDLAMALDPVLFAEQALGFFPDPSQAEVLRWRGKRLLLNCSRQYGKSTTSSALAAHQAIFTSDSLILLVSPSLRQSTELFRKVSRFLDKPKDQIRKVEDNRLSLELENGSRIVSLPNKEETVRGFSNAALIIEDEASRVDDDLYKAMRPMLAVGGGRLILMSTPAGRSGHFYEEWANGGETWERVEVKATDCSRIPKTFLDDERKSLGEWWFRQEYLCEFVDSVDNVFDHDLVMAAISKDVKPLFGGK
jgi:hypothetical protein